MSSSAGRPPRRTPAASAARWTLIGLGIFLPVLTLIPLGSLWLWQNGYLIPWAIAAVVITIAFYVALRRLILPPAAVFETERPVESVEAGPPDPGWTPAESAAWLQVQARRALHRLARAAAWVAAG